MQGGVAICIWGILCPTSEGGEEEDGVWKWEKGQKHTHSPTRSLRCEVMLSLHFQWHNGGQYDCQGHQEGGHLGLHPPHIPKQSESSKEQDGGSCGKMGNKMECVMRSKMGGEDSPTCSSCLMSLDSTHSNSSCSSCSASIVCSMYFRWMYLADMYSWRFSLYREGA